MPNPKTLAKKQARARLAGTPATPGVTGDFGERVKLVNEQLAKRYGSPSRVDAPELLRDGREGVSFVRVVLRGAVRVARFKTAVARAFIEQNPLEQVADHIYRTQEGALTDYLSKELGNHRLKVAIEDERAMREQN